MVKVTIPSLMRDLTGGEVEVSVPGRSVQQVIEALDAQYPGVKHRLCDGDQLAGTLVVSIDGRISRLGLFQPVKEESHIRFLPAIEGG